MMIIALYIAMWLSYIAGTTTTWIWTLITILPGISSTYMFFYIVKTASLLKAISILDHDLMIETIEDTQSVKQLGDELRAKIIQQLNITTTTTSNDNNNNDNNNDRSSSYSYDRIDPYTKLESIFKHLDVSQNGYLSLTEFLQLSEILDVNFSKRRWKQIYRIIDKNFDNQVSFQEFYVFLYPEHELAKSLENRRMKIIKKRVLQTANNYFHKNISNSAAKIRQLFSSSHRFDTSSSTTTSIKEGIDSDSECGRNSFYSKSLQALNDQFGWTKRGPKKEMKITTIDVGGSNSSGKEVTINIIEKEQIVFDDNHASEIATNIDSTTTSTPKDLTINYTNIIDPSTSPSIIDPTIIPFVVTEAIERSIIIDSIEESMISSHNKHLNTPATPDYDEHHDDDNNDHDDHHDGVDHDDDDGHNNGNIDDDVIEVQLNHPNDDISLISDMRTLVITGGDKLLHPSDYNDQKAAMITAMMTAKYDDDAVDDDVDDNKQKDDKQQDDKCSGFDQIIGANNDDDNRNDDDGDDDRHDDGDHHIIDGGNSILTYEEYNYSDGDSYEDVEDPMLYLSADSVETFRDCDIRSRR